MNRPRSISTDQSTAPRSTPSPFGADFPALRDPFDSVHQQLRRINLGQNLLQQSSLQRELFQADIAHLISQIRLDQRSIDKCLDELVKRLMVLSDV